MVREHREPDDGDVRLWTDPKVPAHSIAQANREKKLGISGMDKVVAFDQGQSLDDFLGRPRKTGRERRARTKR